MNLCGRQEDRVLVRQRVVAARRRPLDRDVRRGRREVPERERAVAVQQVGDRARVRDDARHVAGGRERADLERARLVRRELQLELGEVDVAVGVLADHDHVGDRLAPRQLVGVVLERPDEHHRALLRRDVAGRSYESSRSAGIRRFEDPDQLVDRGRRAGAAEDHDRLVVTADRVVDDPPRVLAQAGRLQPGAARLGVRVRVPRQHLVADEVLDEARAPGRSRCSRRR